MGLCGAWIEEDDLGCDVTDVDAAVVGRSIQAASEALYEFSGRQFPGICEDVVRPTRHALQGNHDDGCERFSILRLPRGPIGDVTEVLLDGDVLDPSGYKKIDGRSIMRRPDADGRRQVWPCWQRLDLGVDQPDTFQVSYTYGANPPDLGVIAVAALACELIAADPSTKGECSIPDKVTTVSRQGVSMTVVDPSAFLKDGSTGIKVVDLFLEAVNPQRLMTAGGVLNPDLIPVAHREG